jgi:hypothetical protein
LSFAQSRVSGYLYSDNHDSTPDNAEFHSLSVLLEKYFDLFPTRHLYEDRFQGRLDSPEWRYLITGRKHFGVPKGSGRTIPTVTIIGVSGFSPKEYRTLRMVRWLYPMWTRYLRKILLWQLVKPLIPMWIRRLLYRVIYE